MAYSCFSSYRLYKIGLRDLSRVSGRILDNRRFAALLDTRVSDHLTGLLQITLDSLRRRSVL